MEVDNNKPIAQKLGIKKGFSLAIINEPKDYFSILGELPENTRIWKNAKAAEADFVHLFAFDRSFLEDNVLFAKSLLRKHGMLWISWPKKSSGTDSDLNGNIIRETGLAIGLVDIKICSFSNIWSALKFVYRTKDR